MERIKYPRTPHLPWSPGRTVDDIALDFDDVFVNKEVVITEKMDGENTTLTRDYTHARSVDGRHHASRTWLKRFHGEIAHLIPNGVRICGEYLYAQHSIKYDNLKSYFYGFSVWKGNICWDWDQSLELMDRLGIEAVPVFYRMPYDASFIRSLTLNHDKIEGYVIRKTESFLLPDFAQSVAKYVRPNHVTTDEHWMNAAIVPNQLGGKRAI